jgi:hypothetical protein
MPGGTFAVPRGQRHDDTKNVADDLTLWRGLDPKQAWNASNYHPQAPAYTVHISAIRTEELSTAVSDRTNLAALQRRFPGWKMATFTVREARNAGYIAMRDPTNPEDVVLYDRANPDGRPSKSVSKALARIARIS